MVSLVFFCKLSTAEETFLNKDNCHFGMILTPSSLQVLVYQMNLIKYQNFLNGTAILVTG